jgi:hypothetical protein
MNPTPAEDATNIIASALQMLIDGVRPQGSNYLIVSAGHAYLQFARDWGDVSIQAEAVSNFYLAKDRQLDDSAIETLHGMGFEDPGVEISAGDYRSATTATEIARGAPARSPNYFRYFDISTPEEVGALADLVVQVLGVVYGVDPQARLKLQLVLGDAAAPVAEPEASPRELQPLSVDEPAWALWSIRLSPDKQPVIYETTTGEEIATVHGEELAAFKRALLLQRAPDLLDAVRAAAGVFSLVADGRIELDPATALELLPVLQASLELLEDPAP